MKRFLHKLPLSVLAGLCLAGCGGNRSNNTIENECSESAWHKIDTVYVLNTHPYIYYRRPRIWATDKSGADFDGYFLLDDGVVFPQTGDVVVLSSAPNSPLDCYKVVKNITAEKRKSEYINSK